MRTHVSLRRLVAAAAGVAALVLASALPASGHAELVSSDPSAGAAVRTLPHAVTLTFSEPVRTPAFLEVTGPGAVDVAAGDVRIVDADVTQRLGEPVGAGRYALSYRITSDDGHSVSGTVAFTVSSNAGGAGSTTPDATPQPSPSQPSATEESGGIGTTQLVLLLAAFALGVVVLALATRRVLKHSVAMVEDRHSGRSRRP